MVGCEDHTQCHTYTAGRCLITRYSVCAGDRADHLWVSEDHGASIAASTRVRCAQFSSRTGSVSVRICMVTYTFTTAGFG